tara:strand:+ start:1825 stop:4221 length:2397 start_codon:yes stop_codon:yes gene_type:complete
MSHQIQSISKTFKRFYLICFLALSMGIPLIFSSITRSVFEVNKLLFLRIIILILCGAWLLKSCILKDNNLEPPKEQSYELFGFRWRRIGLEIPILFWIATNLISIIISRNIFISLIGAYDRWEGLMTILNYIVLFIMTAKLIDNTKYRIIIFCICLFSTAVSAFYGVIQSLGLDFMNWSADPTMRVFACINNPVHFCAYVAMTVPLGLALSHYLLSTLKAKSSDLITPQSHYLYFGFTLGYSIISAIILNLLSAFSLSSFLQFTTFFLAISFIFYTYYDLIPKKTAIFYSALLILSFFGLSIFDYFLLSNYEVTLLAFGAGALYCLRVIHNRRLFLFRLCNVTTLLVFYAMLLSFSRATIIAYVICISFFYQLILQTNKSTMSLSKWILLFFGSSITHIFLIFKVHLFGFYPTVLALIVGFVSFWLLYYSSTGILIPSKKEIKSLLSSFILFTSLIIPFLAIPFFNSQIMIICLYIVGLCFLLQRYIPVNFFKNCLCLFILLNLLFYTSSIGHIFLYLTLVSVLYIYILKPNVDQTDQFYICSFLVLKLTLVIIPLTLVLKKSSLDFIFNLTLLPHLINYILIFLLIISLLYIATKTLSKLTLVTVLSFFIIMGIVIQINTTITNPYQLSQSQEDSLLVAQTIEGRMNNLSNNRARLFMWLSVPAWVLDNPLFGSGPDTIRHLYPLYRHPKYGIHEGGHNFTPDRLHNEYLNTLSTNGIIGFIIKYIFLYGAWYLIMIKLFIKYAHTQKRYILAGIIVAPSIYLVQVLFNFGVVATLFLFYFLLGIGLSFVNDEYTSS